MNLYSLDTPELLELIVESAGPEAELPVAGFRQRKANRHARAAQDRGAAGNALVD
jgi:hypothetical protein